MRDFCRYGKIRWIQEGLCFLEKVFKDNPIKCNDVFGFFPSREDIFGGFLGTIEMFRVVEDAKAADISYNGKIYRKILSCPWQVSKAGFKIQIEQLLKNGSKLQAINGPRHSFGSVTIAYEVV